ncbi:MAG TPA: tetratricopeptide repeat protein [Chitinophagaceae bacterium]|jgi:signal transduction histidine kinase|nr:tetratricopeptide repeat protein [Chitinophagaceae bacterium]HMU59118.1 tetratricopeptide repeat protein [Chitinophagaceae bacterium]
MKAIFLTVFFILSCININAQSDRLIDSMLQILRTAKEDSNQVFLLLNLGEQYERVAPETSKQYYQQSLQLSKKIGYKQGEIKFASYYTAVLNMQGKFDSSLILNKNALALAKQLNDELNIAKTTLNTANSFHMLAKEDSALYYYMQVLPMLDKIGNKRMLGIAYSNIQNIYTDLSQYEKAIAYGKKGLAIFTEEVNDPLNQSYCLSNLGIVYHSLKKMDTAEIYFKHALQISQSIGDRYTESAVLLNLGDIHYKQGRLESSKKNFEKSYQLANEMDLMETKAIALKGMAMYHLEKKNYIMARHLADSALTISIANNIRKQSLMLYGLLSDISYANQDLKLAHKFEEKEDALRDSVNAGNLQEITTEFETKYETQKKTEQIRLQQAQIKQKSTLNYFLIAGTIALLAILLLSYRNYKHRQKLQQAKIDEFETEKLLTATEAVLKGEEQERSRLAKDLHDGLGGMLSGIKHSLNTMKENLIMTPDNAQAFERSVDMLDSSIKEMRRVAHNMMPEMLMKYGLDTALKEFCREITQSGVTKANYQSIHLQNAVIEQTTSVTIYRIAQELVNNAIKHGKAKEVLVQLHFHEQEKLLALTVEDDGSGFDINLLNEAKGMGWKNIQSRVDFLKGKTDTQSAPGKGTSVMIEINI